MKTRIYRTLKTMDLKNKYEAGSSFKKKDYRGDS